MKKNFLNIAILAITATSLLASCGGNTKQDNEKSAPVALSGAGATFPEPYYNVAFEGFHETSGNTVSYGGIGSGGGIRNLKDKIVDFAGSDAFLSDEEMAEMNPVVHIPTCMGAVVLAYNLQGVGKLNLTGDLVVDIFAGKVTKWNDKRIAEVNPDVKLPNKKIIPVFRSDGSGTTFVFTSYLSGISDEWSTKYGASKSVNFPTGQAAKGNPGVAGVINQTDGSIGYVGSEYAFAQKIPFATLQNAQGEFVVANAKSISAAASGDIPADTRTMIVNSAAVGAYPISCFTWIVVYKDQNYSNRTIDQAKATVELLQYMLSNDAQKMTSQVNYAPLPKAAIEKSLNNLKQITYNGHPLVK